LLYGLPAKAHTMWQLVYINNNHHHYSKTDHSYFKFSELLYLPGPSTMHLSYLLLVGPAGGGVGFAPKTMLQTPNWKMKQ